MTDIPREVLVLLRKARAESDRRTAAGELLEHTHAPDGGDPTDLLACLRDQTRDLQRSENATFEILVDILQHLAGLDVPHLQLVTDHE